MDTQNKACRRCNGTGEYWDMNQGTVPCGLCGPQNPLAVRIIELERLVGEAAGECEKAKNVCHAHGLDRVGEALRSLAARLRDAAMKGDG